MKALYKIEGVDATGKVAHTAIAHAGPELVGAITLIGIQLEKDWVEFEIKVTMVIQEEAEDETNKANH